MTPAPSSRSLSSIIATTSTPSPRSREISPSTTAFSPLGAALRYRLCTTSTFTAACSAATGVWRRSAGTVGCPPSISAKAVGAPEKTGTPTRHRIRAGLRVPRERARTRSQKLRRSERPRRPLSLPTGAPSSPAEGCRCRPRPQWHRSPRSGSLTGQARARSDLGMGASRLRRPRDQARVRVAALLRARPLRAPRRRSSVLRPTPSPLVLRHRPVTVPAPGPRCRTVALATPQVCRLAGSNRLRGAPRVRLGSTPAKDSVYALHRCTAYEAPARAAATMVAAAPSRVIAAIGTPQTLYVRGCSRCASCRHHSVLRHTRFASRLDPLPHVGGIWLRLTLGGEIDR